MLVIGKRGEKMKRSCIIFSALLMLLLLGACSSDAAAEPTPTPAPVPPQLLSMGDKFQNNVIDNKDAYVICQITLEAETEADLQILTENKSRIRDIINGILRKMPQKSLEAADATAILSARVGEEIVLELQILSLRGVYFDSYYIATK